MWAWAFIGYDTIKYPSTYPLSSTLEIENMNMLVITCKLVSVLFVQETCMLLPGICMSCIIYVMTLCAVSSITDASILVGRPFGGVTL